MRQFHWTNLNDSSYIPSFGSLRTIKFTSDVYINNMFHELRFLTFTINLEVFNILTITDHYMRVVWG